MPDDNDLRFTMELKDEFTAVFNKVKDTVMETVPKLKSSIGGLSKGLAIVGGAAAVGTAVYAGWNMFKSKIADVTKEAEALEKTLGNILGSKGAAKNVITELANTDLTKVFKIKDIDESYTNLANHGLKATLAQMNAIGDLGANTGKGIGAVVNSIITGGEGKIKGLQDLGIDVVKQKNKKAGIDNLTLSFRGQTQTIKNSSAAIQEYLLNLGMMPGVQGSMARMNDTVAASENNLSNQIDKVWSSLAERFNPGVIESKNQLSKWVATINSWIEIPIEKKINDQIVQIRILQTELTSSNTSEERRKTLLQELHELNPKITEGIDNEAISYDKLAQNINAVTTALTQKITLANIDKRFSSVLSDYADASGNVANANSSIMQAVYAASPELASRTDLSLGQKQMEARKILKARIKKAGFDSPEMELSGMFHDAENGSINVNASTLSDFTRIGSKLNPERKDIYSLFGLEKGIRLNNQAVDVIKKLNPDIAKMNNEKNTLSSNISKSLGLDSVAGKDKTGGLDGLSNTGNSKTSIDKNGIASVRGGGQIKNITINIQNLVSGGVNLQTITLKEGVSKAKDIVVEGLLTAVNDANLVGN